jgi:hypothetical protein
VGGREELDAEHKARKAIVAALRAAEQREARLREALEWIAFTAWDHLHIDGGDFQDEMVRRGIMVEVPASDEMRDEYGVETMYALAWDKDAARKEAGDE